MGGCTFEDVAFGKTCQDAFSRCVDEARYNYGHAGYTGTIAEKDQFVEFKCPPRVKVRTMHDWAAGWDGPGDDSKHADLASSMQQVYDQKWGPAVAIKYGPAEEKAFREAHGYKGKKGGVWLFCGWASS